MRNPTAEAEVLARFKDGGAAVVRHGYGKGTVYVVGLWPALEYSATRARITTNRAMGLPHQK